MVKDEIAVAYLVENLKNMLMKVMTIPPPPIPATLHKAIEIIKMMRPPISIG